MREQFVPYELALKLKELGFNEDYLGVWMKDRSLVIKGEQLYDDIKAPLWQQVFDWFRCQYSLHTEIRSYTAERFTFVIQELKNTVKYIEYGGINNTFKTYQEARQSCLLKLIELCKKN